MILNGAYSLKHSCYPNRECRRCRLHLLSGHTQQRGCLATPQRQQTYALPWQQHGPLAIPQLAPQQEPVSIQQAYGVLQRPAPQLQQLGYPEQPPAAPVQQQPDLRPTGYPQQPPTQMPPQQPASVAGLQALSPVLNNALVSNSYGGRNGPTGICCTEYS